jgi:hypothetical protein
MSYYENAAIKRLVEQFLRSDPAIKIGVRTYLEFLIRTQIRVFVVQTNDVTDRQQTVLPMIQERTAPCLHVHGPT